MTYCGLTSKKKVGVESLRLERPLRLDIIIVQLFTNHLCKQSIHICLTLSKMILLFPRFRSYILLKVLYFDFARTHLNPITPWQGWSPNSYQFKFFKFYRAGHFWMKTSLVSLKWANSSYVS